MLIRRFLVTVFALVYVLKQSGVCSSERQVICKNKSLAQRRNLQIFIHKPSLEAETNTLSTSLNNSFTNNLIFIVFDHTSTALLSSFDLFIRTTQLRELNSVLSNYVGLNTHITQTELKFNSEHLFIFQMLPLSIQDQNLAKQYIKKAYANRTYSEFIAEILLNHIHNETTLNSIRTWKLRLKHTTKSKILHNEHKNILVHHKKVHRIVVNLPKNVPILFLLGNYIKFKLTYKINYNYKCCILSNISINHFTIDQEKIDEWYQIRTSANFNKNLTMNDFLTMVKRLSKKRIGLNKKSNILDNLNEVEIIRKEDKDPFEVDDLGEFLEVDDLMNVLEIDSK